MAFWDRFKRDRVVTEDVDVYAKEPGTGKVASFLFGFFALFVTLLIIGGLFFAGRAVYRAVTDNSDGNSAQNQGQENVNDQKATPATPAPAGEGSSNSSNNSGSNNSSGSNGQSPATGDSPTSVPRTGDDETPPTQSLPRTGDEGL